MQEKTTNVQVTEACLTSLIKQKHQRLFETDFKKVSHSIEKNLLFECKNIFAEFFLLLYTKIQLLYCLLSSPDIV